MSNEQMEWERVKREALWRKIIVGVIIVLVIVFYWNRADECSKRDNCQNNDFEAHSND